MQHDDADRVSTGRIIAANGFLLTALYLGAGLALELVRRVHPTEWAMRATTVLDALPARALALVGALEPLTNLYLDGHIREWALRVVFGVTTVAIIFALAAVVGLAMAGLRRS